MTFKIFFVYNVLLGRREEGKTPRGVFSGTNNYVLDGG